MEYALSIAEHLSFSKSSEELFVSQSAISQSISRLENELGYKIFLRTTKKVELTEKGKHSIELMRRIVDLSKELIAINSMDDGSFNVRIAVVKGLYLPFMVELLNNPKFGTMLRFSEDDSIKIVEDIKQGSIDVGIVPIYKKNINIIDSLRVLPLLDIDLYVFVSKHSRLANYDSVCINHLTGEKIAMYDGSYLKWLMNLVLKNNKGIEVLFYSTNQEFIREFVLQNNAISIDTISETIVNSYIDSNEIVAVPLRLDFPHHSFLGLVTNKESYNNYNFNELVELIYELIAKETKTL